MDEEEEEDDDDDDDDDVDATRARPSRTAPSATS